MVEACEAVVLERSLRGSTSAALAPSPQLDDSAIEDIEVGSRSSGSEHAGAPVLTRHISPRSATHHDSRLVACSVPSPACGDKFEAPLYDFSEFRQKIRELAKEYYVSRDCRGMLASIAALKCPSYHDELVAELIRGAMDRGVGEREAVIVLLNEMFREQLLTDGQMARGYEKLVLSWQDLQLDVPDAPGQLAELLSSKVGLLDEDLFARLPERLLQQLSKNLQEGSAKAGLERHLKELVHFKAGLEPAVSAALGKSHNFSPMAEYLAEANQAHFHHEVVVAVCQACFTSDEVHFREQQRLALALLQELSGAEGGLTEVDLQMGFSRLLGTVQHSGGRLTAELSRNQRDQVTSLLRGAVETELLPAEFLKSARRLRFGGAEGVEVVRSAQRQTPLYSRRVWGAGDMKHFRQEVAESIIEYFDSKSETELGRIVEELHLSEEEQAMFIRKLLVTGMERKQADVALTAVEKLLGRCWSLQEVRRGFEELRGVQEDLVLDFPQVRECTTELVREAVKRSLLEQQDLVCDNASIV
eukprot:CAMPEP_0206459250 /NCGR_PEP_ID=MMETSP0324_2-20121206/24066_1 /ASSEMBLY_ACC=CAM_ASM_000836 /TAXON_ID=2866 /ORGANISM="Crypthecodinium cohnii, Strain Seligo" /LENGTH=530 /DNA_ID=CAMNT_0053930769 /DNA_START=65 /DNA_END=1657 /DNA_ORIENTATION=+